MNDLPDNINTNRRRWGWRVVTNFYTIVKISEISAEPTNGELETTRECYDVMRFPKMRRGLSHC